MELFLCRHLEILFWVFFAFLTWPKTIAHPNDFFDLSLPIIITNTIAVSLFYMVLEFYTHQRDTEKSETTKTTFDAVNTLSPHSTTVSTASMYPKLPRS